ncbi:MAG: hypothetical protein R3229_17010 [Alphaproteobacteria bacterium]|nr:hypothetical protein [Alphaproteobacteria bacterium]
MITVREISTGIYGAWRLALGDKSGLTYFDATAEGALRSFHAALIALPIASVYLALDLGRQEITAPVAMVVVVFLLSFALDWAAFPLAVLRLAPMMGFDDRVLRYIPALNWARVLELVVLMPAAMVGMGDPLAMGALLRLILMVAVLVYHWFVAKTALEVTGGQAALLVAINLLLGFMIGLWGFSLVR